MGRDSKGEAWRRVNKKEREKARQEGAGGSGFKGGIFP